MDREKLNLALESVQTANILLRDSLGDSHGYVKGALIELGYAIGLMTDLREASSLRGTHYSCICTKCGSHMFEHISVDIQTPHECSSCKKIDGVLMKWIDYAVLRARDIQQTAEYMTMLELASDLMHIRKHIVELQEDGAVE